MEEPSLHAVRHGRETQAILWALVARRSTFLAFFGATLAATLAGSLLTEPRYEATTVIQLLPNAGQEMKVAEVVTTAGGYYETRDRARTQMQVILSRSVREEVVRRYNALGGDQLDTTPDGLDDLLGRMTVTPREDTQLVEIGVTDSDAERAARVANLIAAVYFDANLAARTDAARGARRWLDGRVEDARVDLREANARVLAFLVAHDGVDLDEAEDDIGARRDALQTALGATTTERVLLGSRLEEHQRLLEQGDAALLDGAFDDPGLAALAQERAVLVTRSAEILSKYGEEHPEHQAAVAYHRRVEALLANAVKRNVESEEALLGSLVRQERDIRAELARTKQERLEKERLSAEFTELTLERDHAWRLHGALTERAAEVELQAESRLSDVRIVDSALPPRRPVTPDLVLNLVVGLGVGLVGGIAAALARDRLEEKPQSQVPLLAANP